MVSAFLMNLYDDHMASTLVFVMHLEKALQDSKTQLMHSHINVVFEINATVHEVAHAEAKANRYKGSINTDPSKSADSRKKRKSYERLNKLDRAQRVSIPLGLEYLSRNACSSELFGRVAPL